MKNKFEPDQIGRIGEREFERLCEIAGLYCNKSNVDTMGWDFIVEAPVASNPQLSSLDQRLNNVVHVQLKSTSVGSRNHRIRLSLSAIDRLAKNLGPTVIVVFRLRDDGELQSSYLVHLIDAELARILERLRKAEERQERDINHTEISFDYVKVGVSFPPTPDGLRTALEKVCGDDPRAYVTEKQRQLSELGYENGQFEAEIIVPFEGVDHFSNLLLGIIPVKPRSFQVFDKRFGVRIPYNGDLFKEVNEITLTPPTLGACEILIREPGFGRTAHFEGTMFIGPPIGEVHNWQLIVRIPGVLIRITTQEITWEFLCTHDGINRTVVEWAELFRAKVLLEKNGSILKIAGNSKISPISATVNHSAIKVINPHTRRLSNFLDGWLQLLNKTGKGSAQKFPLSECWSANEAQMATDILLNPNPETFFEFKNLGTVEKSLPIEAIYYNTVSFADVSLTFSVKVFFDISSDPDFPYKSIRFEPLDIIPAVENLTEYGESQAEAFDLCIALHIAMCSITPSNGVFSSGIEEGL